MWLVSMSDQVSSRGPDYDAAWSDRIGIGLVTCSRIDGGEGVGLVCWLLEIQYAWDSGVQSLFSTPKPTRQIGIPSSTALLTLFLRLHPPIINIVIERDGTTAPLQQNRALLRLQPTQNEPLSSAPISSITTPKAALLSLYRLCRQLET